MCCILLVSALIGASETKKDRQIPAPVLRKVNKHKHCMHKHCIHKHCIHKHCMCKHCMHKHCMHKHWAYSANNSIYQNPLQLGKDHSCLITLIFFFEHCFFFFLLLCFYWLFWFQFCFFYFKLIWFLLVLVAFSCSCGSNLFKGEQTMISDSSPRRFLRLSNLGTAK